MTTYTPGPYTVRPSQFDNELLILADETCIAAVPIWENDDEGDTLAEQSRANAALLVAAPELLEALELCVDVLGELARLDDGTPSVSALNMARAALAKARSA